MEIAEDAPLGSETIQVWGLKTPCAKYANVGIALVVGENNDDVRQGVGFGSIARSCTNCESTKKPKNWQGRVPPSPKLFRKYGDAVERVPANFWSRFVGRSLSLHSANPFGSEAGLSAIKKSIGHPR